MQGNRAWFQILTQVTTKNLNPQKKSDHKSSPLLIQQLQSTLAASLPSSLRMCHPLMMSDAKPPIMIVDRRARSVQQSGLHSSWYQEFAAKVNRVAKTDKAKNAIKSTRGHLM